MYISPFFKKKFNEKRNAQFETQSKITDYKTYCNAWEDSKPLLKLNSSIMGLKLFKLLSVVFDGHLLLFYIVIHEHRLQFILNNSNFNLWNCIYDYSVDKLAKNSVYFSTSKKM